MEKLLAGPLTPALAAGWQSTQDNRKAFREPGFLLAVQAGALAELSPGGCSIPCRICLGRGAGARGLPEQGLPRHGEGCSEGQRCGSQHGYVGWLVNHRWRFCSVGFVMGTLICCWD